MNVLRPARIAGLLVALSVVLGPRSAPADWINLTGAETAPNIAEIAVLEDRVRVVFEIYVGDLEVFSDLVPDDWVKDPAGRAPLAERLEGFAQSVFTVQADGGEPLPVSVELVEARTRKDRRSPFAGMINPITRQRVPEAPADKRVLYVELSYPFQGAPERLTFTPPLDEEGRARVSIGFIAYHGPVPIIDFRYLGSPAHLNLNWDDPWYTRFDHPNLKRHHASAMMSFLYVEPYEVRHEALVRVRDLGRWMDLGLADPKVIEPGEREALKTRIGELFLERNPVRVDGELVAPILDRVDFVTVGLQGIRIVEHSEPMETSATIVGVILAYLVQGLPQEVTVDWELFTDRVQRVPTTATDPAGPLPGYVTPDDNVITWTNFLKTYVTPEVRRVPAVAGTFEIPVATVMAGAICLGLLVWRWRRSRSGSTARATMVAATVALVAAAGLLPYARVSVARPGLMMPDLAEEEARTVVESLLGNVYRAFDFRDEATVYDKLALTVSGDLLTDVYLQSRRSFAVQRAGGAQAKVKEVEVREARASRSENGPGYDVKAVWSARGSVGHWGHVHTRENLYEAQLRLEPVDGFWKITGLELIEEQRTI